MNSNLRCSSRVVGTLLAASLLAVGLGTATLTGCGSGDGGSDGNDVDEIEIEITAPEQDSYHSHDRVMIEGTAEHVDEVEVNGQTATVHDGDWDVTVEFDDGPVTATASSHNVEDSVDFVVDTTHPQVVIDTPDRGTMLDDEDDDGHETITVAGTVEDAGASGLLLFQVDGTTLEIEDGDSFEETVDLQPGLNVISVSAIDRAHNQTEKHRAVVFGPLTDPDAPIEEAARLDIDHPSGTGAIAEIIESYVTPDQIEEFLDDGLDDGDLSVEIHELDWDDLDVELIPDDGTLDVVLTIDDLFVSGDFSFGGSDPIHGDVLIGQVTVELEVALSADDDDQLEIDVVDDDIDLEDTTVNIDGEESDEAAVLVAGAIRYAFHEFLEELVEDNLYDPDMLTQEIEFLDETIVVTLLIEEILITSAGILVRLGIEFPAEKGSAVPDVPGALDRELQQSLGGSVPRPFVAHSSRTAFERVLHVLWQSGLLHQNIGRDDDIDMPIELTAGGLATLLDNRISDIHGSETPVELGLRPLLPPVVEFGTDQEATVKMGDFLVDFFLRPDDGTGVETLFLTVALQLDIDIEFELNGDEFDLDVDVDAVADIDDEPEFRFDPDSTTDLIIDLIEIVPDLALDDLDIEPEASLEWATIGDFKVVFNDGDRISIGLDIEPADDFIDDDDVEAESQD